MKEREDEKTHSKWPEVDLNPELCSSLTAHQSPAQSSKLNLQVNKVCSDSVQTERNYTCISQIDVLRIISISLRC